jgi:hypothetical protein
MAGHRSFKELTKGISPKRKARVAARVTQLKADMPLLENLATPSDQPGGRREHASRVTGPNELPSRAK